MLEARTFRTTTRTERVGIFLALNGKRDRDSDPMAPQINLLRARRQHRAASGESADASLADVARRLVASQ